jgi:hypothetical protein
MHLNKGNACALKRSQPLEHQANESCTKKVTDTWSIKTNVSAVALTVTSQLLGVTKTVQ